MTEDIKKTMTLTKNITVLTKVTCDCCKKVLGDFHLNHDPIAGYAGFKAVPNAKPIEWYHVVKSQTYETTTEWTYDICPDCLPQWITEFRDIERGCSDYMELCLEHNVDYPQVLVENENV